MHHSRTAIVVLAIGALGCTRLEPVPEQPLPTFSSSPTKIQGLPVRLTVTQRSTTEIPGSDGRLSVTVDDITSGQVMVSILRDGGDAAVGPVSMKEGDAQIFEFSSVTYSLQLVALTNALIGEDYASFVISERDPAALSESEKIQHLIATLESMKGAVFIRNGTEHTAKEAADHMRRKLKSGGDKINSAADFIDHIASKSSITGNAYTIRLSNNKTVPSREFMYAELAKIDSGGLKAAGDGESVGDVELP